MKDYIVQSKLPACCIKEFLGSINSIKIDQIVVEGNLEALVDLKRNLLAIGTLTYGYLVQIVVMMQSSLHI
ncbi:hypothetical protein DM558_01455 [Entomomonas moraniae]|uniref:Uncharacterized protein n=1 Tax=Entomomonas moraniae TaxID=2213226 RepID=A0A3S9XAR2_9GAMM|nr:hypothetical protein DM558_01455 [Entomomonas moraniae]